MAKLGPEYVGKLPPGAAEDLKAELEQCREMVKLGIAKGVEILPGPGCAVAEHQAGNVYLVGQVPSLPFPGCDRSPCCGCCFNAVLA